MFDPRVAGSLVGHFASAINGASIARKTSFLQRQARRADFCARHQHLDDPLRKRGLRSRPFDAEGVAGQQAALGRRRRAQNLAARLRDRARTRHDDHRPRVARRLIDAFAGRTNLHLEPGTQSPEQLIADIADGFYVNDLIGMGVNLVTGDYSRGAAGFWIENGKITYPVSEVTIAGHLTDIFRSLTPANDLDLPLRHQCADRCASRV